MRSIRKSNVPRKMNSLPCLNTNILFLEWLLKVFEIQIYLFSDDGRKLTQLNSWEKVFRDDFFVVFRWNHQNHLQFLNHTWKQELLLLVNWNSFVFKKNYLDIHLSKVDNNVYVYIYMSFNRVAPKDNIVLLSNSF